METSYTSFRVDPRSYRRARYRSLYPQVIFLSKALEPGDVFIFTKTAMLVFMSYSGVISGSAIKKHRAKAECKL